MKAVSCAPSSILMLDNTGRKFVWTLCFSEDLSKIEDRQLVKKAISGNVKCAERIASSGVS